MPGIGSALMSGLGASNLAAGSSVAGIAAMANKTTTNWITRCY